MRRRYKIPQFPRSAHVRMWSLERTLREYATASFYFEALRPAQKRVVIGAVTHKMRAAIAARPSARLYDPQENVNDAKIRRLIAQERAALNLS